jgi:hypothetical protein
LPRIDEEDNMPNLSHKFLSMLVFLAASATTSAFAAPADSQLLRMVPAGAEIVSGIADPGTRGATGRILADIDNNNRDFDDCLALIGIDHDKAIDEVIEVASSTEAGDLSDRLLLLSGRFHHGTIFKSALEIGATRNEHDGVSLLVIPPFQREQRRSEQVRWLAILDDRILVFGTPGMVANALDRYVHDERTDPILVQRLAQLRSDANSWSVLAMRPPMLAAHLALYPLSKSWQDALRDVDELAVGIHYGHYDRVEFVLHSRDGNHIGQLLTRVQLVPASLTSVRSLHVERLSTDENCIRGSFTVRVTELDSWLKSVESARSLQAAENNK